jgi:hypothetical protein
MTRCDDPMDWADTYDHLGDALANRISGDKYRSAGEALTCRRSAFDVFRQLADSGDRSAMRKFGYL